MVGPPLALWHNICDTATSLTPTTSAISSITIPADPRCGSILSTACISASLGVDGCENFASGLGLAPSSIASCACKEPLLEEAFTCLYVGNVTCLTTQIATSCLYGYNLCPAFSQFLSSMISKVRSPTRSSPSPCIVYCSRPLTDCAGRRVPTLHRCISLGHRAFKPERHPRRTRFCRQLSQLQRQKSQPVLNRQLEMEEGR
jgi:hypothetical protein